MNEKIKINLNGTAETMLQSFYARAKYSKNKGHFKNYFKIKYYSTYVPLARHQYAKSPDNCAYAETRL